MKQDTQQQADRIFSKALDLPVERREHFLLESCGEDDALKSEVSLLLSQYGSTEKALSSTDPSHTLSAGEAEEGAIAAPGAGDLLGNFRLLERLEGGEEDSFLAETEGSRERVILRVLTPELDNNDVRRIRIESESMTRLEHPGIEPLLEIGTAILGTGPRAFIVTSDTIKPNLVQWVDEQNPSFDKRLNVAMRLVEAIAFSHGRAILDGDLHPERILIDELGHPAIQAVGLPRLLRHHLAATPHEGLACRAPESMDIPWSRLDTRVDLYSLGAILEWLFRHELEDATQWPLEALRRVVSRSHAHDADARYSSSDAMLRDLEKAQHSDHPDTSASLSEDFRAFSIKHPKATILTGIVVVSMLTAIITLISLLA
ncbi:MAG: hypothetical protein CMJ40_03130 [Phycisphaerae bacterium]|nr:hypothetical protein [Phycisphaerae bacterium]